MTRPVSFATVAANTHNEDRACFGYVRNQSLALFSLFDGHGGPVCSSYCAAEFPEIADTYFSQIHNTNASSIEAALRASYENMDREFLATEGVRKKTSGACALTLVLGKERITTAHVGDCRAVLCRRRITREEETEKNEKMSKEMKISKGRSGSRMRIVREYGNANLENNEAQFCKNSKEKRASQSASLQFAEEEKIRIISPASKKSKPFSFSAMEPPVSRISSTRSCSISQNGYISILEAIPLTRDHDVENESEVSDLQARTSDPTPLRRTPFHLKVPGAPLRVAGSLMVTRSLGDGYLKHKNLSMTPYSDYIPYIHASPEITSRLVSVSDLFVVLMSDGLHNLLTNEEIVYLTDGLLRRAAQRFTDECLPDRDLENHSKSVVWRDEQIKASSESKELPSTHKHTPAESQFPSFVHHRDSSTASSPFRVFARPEAADASEWCSAVPADLIRHALRTKVASAHAMSLPDLLSIPCGKRRHFHDDISVVLIVLNPRHYLEEGTRFCLDMDYGCVKEPECRKTKNQNEYPHSPNVTAHSAPDMPEPKIANFTNKDSDRRREVYSPETTRIRKRTDVKPDSNISSTTLLPFTGVSGLSESSKSETFMASTTRLSLETPSNPIGFENTQKAAPYNVGDTVEVRWQQGTLWCRAKIIALSPVKPNRSVSPQHIRYRVEYDDGETEEGVQARYIRCSTWGRANG